MNAHATPPTGSPIATDADPSVPDNAPLIALATGGTGGHVFPAEALARTLGAKGYRLVLITDHRGTKFGGALDEIDRHTISAAAVSGRGPLGRVAALFRLALGYWQAGGLLTRLKPSAVIGFGGYPSVPTMMAASRKRAIRTVIHEQNAVLGRANRLLAPRVDRIATSFERTNMMRDADRAKVIWTGNPIRPEIAALAEFAYQVPDVEGPFNILVVGGSQGAQIFGTTIPAALEQLEPDLKARIHIVQQARDNQVSDLKDRYTKSGIKAEVASFFTNMPDQLRAAHLVICRAGASTMAELIASGRPAILVPYPYAIDDHQTQNAARLSDASGGWMLPESDLTPGRLAHRLTQLMTSDTTLGAAATAGRRIAMPEAAENLADAVVGLLHPSDAPLNQQHLPESTA